MVTNINTQHNIVADLRYCHCYYIISENVLLLQLFVVIVQLVPDIMIYDIKKSGWLIRGIEVKIKGIPPVIPLCEKQTWSYSELS